MKAGIILGLLTGPLMASTNGYDNLIMLNNFQAAEEKGVKWQYLPDKNFDGDVDSDCYYMQLPITTYNEKFAYYQAALGEGWYDWTNNNIPTEKPGQFLHPNKFNKATFGFAFNLSDMETATQAEITDKTQLDFIFSYMIGSTDETSADVVINYILYDFGNNNVLSYDNICTFNPYAEIVNGFPLYNVGINWIVGTPSYVVDETINTKDYRTLGVNIDLTSFLISKNKFNEFNNLIYNNRSNYLALIIDFYEYFNNSFPNDEYATMTSVGVRMGWGQNLENTRYVDGYNTGYNNGYETGYQQGYDNAPKTNTESTVQSLLGALFGSLKDLLDVELLPGISVGTILGIPIVLTIITWVIHWIRG